MTTHDWKRILKADPTPWLLEEENPVVRYWALRDLAGAPRRELAAARRRAVASEVVQEVLRWQRPEGHWEDAANMHAPHYSATIYQLTLLADMGLRAGDARIRKGVAAVLRTQRADGGFPGHDPAKCPYGPYDIGLIIRFMHQFGLGAHASVEAMCAWVQRNQTADGGWVGTRAHCGPAPAGCLNATANVLWGLAGTGRFAGAEVARRGLRFLDRATALLPARGRLLSYPQFWNFWIDDLKLAETCLGLGLGANEQPLAGCLQRILARQGKEGGWVERKGPYPERTPNCMRLRELFPAKGEPSKWLTAKAMIALSLAARRGRFQAPPAT